MDKSIKAPLLLSYHDITAQQCQIVQEELEILRSWGYPRWTLLVVPEGPKSLQKAFSAQLGRWVEQGHDIALHGLRHKADPQLPRTWKGRLAQLLTGQEAEFAGLSAQHAEDLLLQARSVGAELGISENVGFVPPTWHAPEELAYRSLRLGFTFYEARTGLYLSDGLRIRSMPWSIAGLPAPLRALALYYGQNLLGRVGGLPRIALHPGEVSGKDAKQVQRVLNSCATRLNPLSYRDWLQSVTFPL